MTESRVPIKTAADTADNRREPKRIPYADQLKRHRLRVGRRLSFGDADGPAPKPKPEEPEVAG